MVFRVLSRHFGFAGDWEKIGARMSVGVGGGEGIFLSPPPSPSPIFLPPSHWLGKLFTSPQFSTVFLIQDGGLNNRWEYPLARPVEIRLHCRLLFMWLNERKYDILFLQETYCTVEAEDTWRTQWQGKLFLHTVLITAVE